MNDMRTLRRNKFGTCGSLKPRSGALCRFCRYAQFLCLLFTVIFIANFGYAADWKKSATRAETQKRYVTFLEKQGYAASVDRDGDVGFMYDGQYYFIQVIEGSPDFFRIVLATKWKIDSDSDRMRLIIAADYATGTTRVAKIFLNKDEIWVTVEMRLLSQEGYRDQFVPSMKSLQEGMLVFLEKMKELKASGK
jgi:hypothetical protein